MQFDCEIVVDTGNKLGEGVLWSPAHGEVQWTDIFGRRFWAHRPSARAHGAPVGDRQLRHLPAVGRGQLRDGRELARRRWTRRPICRLRGAPSAVSRGSA
jgi:sugar lactone lactonase YvrE